MLMRTTSLLGLSLSLPLACGSLTDSTQTDSSIEALRPLTPFATQFVGTYRDPTPPPGALRELTLERDGRFAADVGDPGPTRGVALVSRRTALPLTFYLWSGREMWPATVRAYDRSLEIERNGRPATLRADGIVGPDETLCDASGGTWTDDDPDPRTGLYCVCPLRETYVPTEGGCVR
jgi:hypothetical protein